MTSFANLLFSPLKVEIDTKYRNIYILYQYVTIIMNGYLKNRKPSVVVNYKRITQNENNRIKYYFYIYLAEAYRSHIIEANSKERELKNKKK